METTLKKIGSWLFLIGICVAVIVGLIFGVGQTMKANLTGFETPLGIIVAVLGFLVDVLSFFALGAVTQEKIPTFLIASIILIGLAIAVSHYIRRPRRHHPCGSFPLGCRKNNTRTSQIKTI